MTTNHPWGHSVKDTDNALKHDCTRDVVAPRDPNLEEMPVSKVMVRTLFLLLHVSIERLKREKLFLWPRSIICRDAQMR
ncbi:hypothetical protein C5167_007871 [Papaver somniferum]|nr:hypothetical protein C5167_007871 [Papaver somniferum]